MTPRPPPPPANTQLVRLAWLNLRAVPPEEHKLDVTLGDVGISQVHTHKSEDDTRVSYLVAGHMELAYFPKICDGRIVVPERERRQIEFAIETLANMRAVFDRIPCSISAPFDGTFFVPESETARKWFHSFDEIHDPSPEKHGRADENWTPINPDEIELGGLVDRLDGLALLSEVLHNTHPMGIYRDLVRLFERAFAVGPKKLTPLVVATVTPEFLYTEAEVECWFNARDAASHADQRRHFLMSSDVVAFVGRMRQAAYDIILNKAEWHKPTTDRRDYWRMRNGAGPNNELFLTRGRPAAITFRALDQFNVWPIDSRSVRSLHVEGMWPRRRKPSSESSPVTDG